MQECWDCAKLREEMEPGESDDDVSEGSRAELSDDDDDNGEVNLQCDIRHSNR